MPEKDKAVIDCLNRLRTVLDFSLIEIVDYWDGDLCAIGLKKGNKLVYINTFPQSLERAVLYDYDLELTELSDKKVHVIKRGRSVAEEDLIYNIKSFLELN